MSLREIVADGVFLGWPTLEYKGRNRQVVYLFLGPDERVTVQKSDDGTTRVIAVDWSWVRSYSAGWEPVIIRRTK